VLKRLGSPRLLGLSAAALVVGLLSLARAQSGDVILRAAAAPVVRGTWSVVADSSAAGGSRLSNPDAGVPKPSTPAATPANYFELTFDATAGRAYQLWIRGKAQGNSYDNDSVYVQFSDSVTAAGAAMWRIGTTSATSIVLEDCSGCGVSGWGWQDNGYGAAVLGPSVYFQNSGAHTMRVQIREDGLSIDQIVLSPSTYLTRAPGAVKNDNTILIGGTPPAQISLVREPYLQQITDGSATIVWASSEPGPARVRVGNLDVAATTTFFPAAATGLGYDHYMHVAQVDGLAPATAYTYDVFVGGVDANATIDRLRTAPTPGTGSFSFVVIGDSGTGSTEQRTLATLIRDDSFDALLHAGDIAYGSTAGIGDASHTTYKSWFFDIYRETLRRVPSVPSMGNHDSRASNGWGRAYLDVFVLPQEGGNGLYPDHAERYYSFDYGPAHVVVLDTELAFQDPARRSAQLAWLDADFASSGQPWKIALFHRAPYSSGADHGSDLTVRAAFVPLFERHGVQIVLSAHEHDYERSVPWREGTDFSKPPILYFVSGGGGGPLYDAGLGEWTAISRKTHHYVRGSVSGCTATFDAIDRIGAVFDRYILDRCQQAQDAAPPTLSFNSPAAGATVSGFVNVTANASDDQRVEKVDLWVDGVLRASDATAPYNLGWDASTAAAGNHTLQLRAYDLDGRRTTMNRTVSVATSTQPPDIVLHATDVSVNDVRGDWAFVTDATAADSIRLASLNRGQKLTASANPTSYFEATFTADAGVPYHLWLRMRAEGNAYDNDSVSVQFSGTVTASGAPTTRIGTTSALAVILEEGSGANVRNWGWNDNGYGTLGGHIYFAASGAQRIRIQVREDGASVDQIVISPARFLTTAPGALKDDATVVP
jgi:acid phosphatase type 7